ncbi:olfactory receptor 13G1-like [Ambystoma mexicanum]|uniref:olfactory receptor 13G1-like n=1 Tax=Ambystoma mexicanum TaxID=8296 RepID=UPI0037E9BFF3
MSFVDLTQAFHKVDRDLLWSKVDAWNCPKQILEPIKALHTDTTMRVKLNQIGTLTDEINTNRGPNQGCPLAPTLFTAFPGDDKESCEELRSFPPKIGGCPVSRLLYADDIILIDQTPIGLQRQLLNNLASYISKNNLEINIGKTKILIIAKTTTKRKTHHWSIDKTKIELVKECCMDKAMVNHVKEIIFEGIEDYCQVAGCKMMHPTLAELRNNTTTTDFFIMGFSSYPQLQASFFASFLLSYLLAMLGNILIISIICSDTHLHTPMYFFLANLAVLDLCCTSITIPKILENLLSESKSISYFACMTQLFLISWALGTELLLLAVMAFDRYVAICHPLHYALLMCKKVYISLGAMVWLVGMFNSMIHTGLILQLSFFVGAELDHFFCEIPLILMISSSDTHIVDRVCLVADILLGMMCFFLTVISYTCILSSIVKIRSAAKKKKAFSTCASHLLVVTLFYGGIIYTYVLPALNFGAGARNKVVSVVYVVVSPLINPLIYSLRNQEVKRAISDIVSFLYCA